MPKIRSLRHHDEMGVFPPADSSYFEEMCWRAENETDSENRGHAQHEVDRMVAEMNDAKEAESVLNKIDVQRLIDHVNESIGQVTEALYFEPNDVVTQMALAATIEGVMKNLHEMDIVYDYKVVCDASNNPPCTIDRGLLNVDVFMKTTKAVHPLHVRGTGGKPLSAATAPVNTQSSSSSANVSSGHHGGYSPQYSSTISAGTLVSNGNGNFTFAGAGAIIDSRTNSVLQSTNPELPKTVFNSFDSAGAPIRLTLDPEPNIAGSEALKLMMLLHAALSNPSAFSVYMYVKKQNLERHFKFEQ